MITVARLREVLDYNPETGDFHWRVTLSQRGLAVALSGCKTSDGYVRIRIEGTLHHAHRLAWIHFYGEVPPQTVDHKNLDRGDNRICNLRKATRSQNSANRGLDKNNTSGFKGVSWFPTREKWVAKIEFQGRQKTIGYFDSREAAALAYSSTADRLFGEFARTA